MMLSAARRICFRIVNPKIMHDKNQIKDDGKLSFYPIVGMKQTKTGIMFFNKPDNNNNITQQCADQFFRFLTSYHHDHTVENVWMQNRGPAFSGGADYQQLLDKPHYLDKLMRLSIRLGEFNKPIFAKVHGSVRGISAYILTMFSTPLGTQKSSLRLDETSKGFVPIFGGSHRLSRLPCHIGLYLALTGDKIDSYQMARLGFLKGKVRDQHTGKQIKRHLSDANLFMKYTYTPSSHSLSQTRKQSYILHKMNYFYDLVSQIQKQIFETGGDVNSKLALNQYRVAQTQYYNTIHPFNSFSKQNYVVNNYFQMRHDRPFKYLKQKAIVQEARTDNNLLPRLPVYNLLKVFSHDSLYKVMEQLKKDQSQWARRTQKMIRQKDPLSLHLTFNLIKNAQKLSWVQCLQQQYKVARRLLNISKIKHIQISKARTLKILTNQFSKSQIQQIPKQKIQQFFRPYQNQSQIFDHDTPNYSFFPTSDYWKQIPDAGRNYLNRTFFEDIHSKFAEIEVRRFLNLNRIDYRDKSYNISTLRQYLYKSMKYGRFIQLEKQRLRAILHSQINYKKLKQSRNNYIAQQIKKQQFQNVIVQQIKNYFEEMFMKRFDQLNKTAKIAGKQSRMQIIRKYINTLTENIVLNGRDIQDNKRQGNLRHGGIVRFDNKNSDVFHAETAHEASINELNALKKAYKNRNSQDLAGIDPKKVKNQYMFFKNQLSQWEYDLLKKDAALRLNYDTSIFQIQIRQKYKKLMQGAAATSEQITSILGWQDSDIQSMILNAPKNDKTFKQFAENTLKNAEDIEQRINEYNLTYKLLQLTKQSQLQKIQNQPEPSPIKNVFFNTEIIPRPFRQAHLALLSEVIQFFSSKYTVNGQISSGFDTKDKQHNFLNQWALKGLQGSFTQLMKNDVEYVFSYLVTLHLKQMLSQLQKSRNTDINSIISSLSSKFAIDFSGMNYNQFNKTFMKYLYAILDMHEESKHRIIFPQSKMIQFINRLKIEKQLSKKYGLSFESLMFLIAKDRKMIKDSTKGVLPLLGYDPQFTLNALAIEQKQQNTIFPKQNQHVEKLDDQPKISPQQKLYEYMREFTNNKYAQQQSKKKLILGFNHYLRRFEAMLQKVAGRTMFLPKQLYELQNKRIYQEAKKLLNVQLGNEEWFKLKLKSAIKHLFDFRFQQERNMTQGELKMFDQQFSQFFTPDYIGIVLRYQNFAEQVLAKLLIKEERPKQTVNEQINSWYLEIKSQVKNPRALKMLNNLIMTQHIVKDKIIQRDENVTQGQASKQNLITQQLQDIQHQRLRIIKARTLDRLTSEMFRYNDQNNQVNSKNLEHVKKALPFEQQIKENRFLSELKQINAMLDGKDLKAQLQNRIRRIQALNL